MSHLQDSIPLNINKFLPKYTIVLRLLPRTSKGITDLL